MSDTIEQFERLVDSILKMDQGTRSLLMNTNLANTRSLKRATDTVRAAPLDSTMSVMHRKYPISVDRKKAKEQRIPLEFLSQTSDAHGVGRILCRTEAVKWYATNGQEASEAAVRTTRKIFAPEFNTWGTFNSIRWANSTVTWGKVSISRRQIVTRKAIVEVPPRFINRTVLYLLGVHITEPILKQGDLEKLRTLRDDMIEGNMSLFRQYHIMRRMLLTEKRFLPVSGSYPLELLKMTPCLFGPSYRVELPEGVMVTRGDDSLSITCETICRVLWESDTEYEATLLSVKVDGVFLDTLLEGCDKYNTHIREVKALMGMKVPIVHKSGTFSLQIKEHEPIWRCHTLADCVAEVDYSKHEFTIEGHEARAHVNMNMGEIVTINVSFCSLATFKRMMTSIADVYHWHARHDKTMAENRAYRAHMIEKEPFCLLHKEGKHAWHPGLKLGGLQVMPIELSIFKMVKMTRDGFTLVSPKGCKVPMVKPKGRAFFPPSVVAPHGWLDAGYDPIEALRRRVTYMVEHFGSVKSCIENGSFRRLNKNFIPYINNPAGVSGRCRFECSELLRFYESQCKGNNSAKILLGTQALICILFCFCYTNNKGASISNTQNILYAGKPISTSFDEGLIIFKDEKVTIGGKDVFDEAELTPTMLSCTILRGYQIRPAPQDTSGIPQSTIKKLSSKSDSISDGSQFIVHWFQPLLVTRDSSLQLRWVRTLKRSIGEVDVSSQFENLLKRLKKSE